MRIKSKEESVKIIDKLNLNVFPSIRATCENKNEILNFLNQNKNCKFAIRDIAKSMSKLYKNNLSYKELKVQLENIKDCIITVSGLTYKEHKLLSGEIFINSNMNIVLTVSSNKDSSARDAAISPEYSFTTSLFENTYKKVPNIDIILNYLFKYELFDVIVEFTIFDIPVGRNQEYVIIWELRTEY